MLSPRQEESEINPVHPSKILIEEFLNPKNIDVYEFRKEIGWEKSFLRPFLAEKIGLNLRKSYELSLYFGNSSRFWLGLQADYERDVVKRRRQISEP